MRVEKIKPSASLRPVREIDISKHGHTREQFFSVEKPILLTQGSCSVLFHYDTESDAVYYFIHDLPNPRILEQVRSASQAAAEVYAVCRKAGVNNFTEKEILRRIINNVFK